MNTIYKYSILGLLPFCAITTRASNTESSDSVKTTQLEEVVVKGENQWIENGKAVFIPTRHAKRLAKDMAKMIQIMNTPMLTGDKGVITTSTGQPVSLFINGLPVDNIDKATFWANNVIRVEFYPETDDPKFLGQKNVLNFVMKEYVTGGLTRLDGSQWIPNNGEYEISSKLVYKRMTYNVMARATYDRDHLSHSEFQETYEDVWYNGSFYDLITRDETNNSISRNNSFSAGVNARYRAEKFYATHGINFTWNQDPNSGEIGSVIYNPSIISSEMLNSGTQSRSNALRINGNYRAQLTKKMMGWANWATGFNHVNNYSNYTEDRETPIVNYFRENSWMLNLQLGMAYVFSQKAAISGQVANNYQNFRATYAGTTSSLQKMDLNQTSITLGGNFNFSSVQFYIMPQIEFYHRNINSSSKQTDIIPGIFVGTSYQPRNKASLGFRVGYGTSSPNSSYVNELILRQTELKWIEGNPGIKPNDHYQVELNWNWIPLSWFSMNTAIRDDIYTNEYAISYRPGGTEYDGIIGQYINGLKNNILYSYISFALKPFGGFSLTPCLIYQYQTVKGIRSLHQLQPKFVASWFFHDFSVLASCRAPEKSLQNGGTNILRTDWGYDLTLSYGNGRFIAEVELADIFNKYQLKKTTVDNGPFHSHRFDWSRGRNIRINVTYYFDYGKKVSPDIDIESISNIDSSILGSN